MRYVLLALLGFLAFTFLVVLGIMWGFGIGWFAGEVGIRSFDHTRAIYADTYDNYNALQQMANNACVAKQAVGTASDANVKDQRQSQLLAIESRYNTVAGEYNAEMQDHFRAKVVKPADLPRTAPPLQEALSAAGC